MAGTKVAESIEDGLIHKRTGANRRARISVCGSNKAFWSNTTTEWSHVTCELCRNKEGRRNWRKPK
jgi:hypothetical protein